MIIEESFVVGAPPERTAAFFLDVPRVAACVPGVQDVRETEPGTYAATLAIRLGPIKSAFQGHLTVDDTDAPRRLIAEAEGRDRSSGSVATIRFTAHLEPADTAATQVHSKADVALRGRLAQFGTGVVRSAATELVRQFADRVNASIDATPADDGPPAATTAPSGAAGRPAAEPRQPPLAVSRLLRVVLVDLVRTLVARLRQVRARLGRRGNIGVRRS